MPELTESECPVELVSAAQLDLSPLTGGIVSNVEEAVTGYAVTTNGVDAGTFATRTEYEDFLASLTGEVALSTVTNVNRTLLGVTTNCVKAVAADLVMTINGTEFAIPFQYNGDEWADALTNDISAVYENVTLTIAPESITAITGGFLPGDEVTYYARVTYDPDDADESGARDVRYYPDNTTATDNGWYVKGGYGVSTNLSAQTFTVPGPDVSAVGEPTVTTDGITWMAHAYSEQGFTNLTATVTTASGTSVSTDLYSGESTNRWTGAYTFTDLAPNTEYTITLAGSGANGNLTAAVTSFTTLPLAPTVTFTALSASEAQITASGNAAGYEVSGGWTPTSATTWTKMGTPNQELEATVYALNKNGGKSAATTATGYTLAAVATKAPAIAKGVTTVDVSAADYAATEDGNPEGTEYAVRVTTSAGGDALVTTNDVAVWQTLADWATKKVTVNEPTIDLGVTNYFSFITRNFSNVASTNATPVTTNCWFVMTAGFTGSAATQQATPFGAVSVPLEFFDPAQRAGATAEVQYKLGDGDWTALASFDVPFTDRTFTTNLTWDAWTAVGKTAGTYEYRLQTKITSGARASEWATVSGTLDFVAPVITFTSKPATLANTGDYTFAVTVDDASAIAAQTYTLDGEAAELSGSVADGSHTFTVTATDAFGNVGTASHTWTADTTAPVWAATPITGTPANGANTMDTAYSLTASATDALSSADKLTYHWTMGETTGDAATFAGSFKNDGTDDGVHTALVYVVDAALNVSTTNSWIWTLDTIAPTQPEIAGTPANGALTNKRAIALTASSTDVSTLAYHWTLDGTAVDGSDATLAREIATDGDHAVEVYATDAAGNVSPTNSLSWTLDTTAPTGLAIDGQPAAVTSVAMATLTASATDAHDVAADLTYTWRFNTGAATTGDTLAVTALEGTNTVSVYATDKAGNACAPVTCTWVLDTTAPTALAVTGTPADGTVTNVKRFDFAVSATDATDITYLWLYGDKTIDGATFARDIDGDGAYSVKVYATDAANNVSVTNTVSWTLDTQRPSVTSLASETPILFNATDPFTVTVTFSEAVTNFTAASVTVGNGTATACTGSDTVYTVTIAPSADGDVTVSVPANMVADAAGNTNEASAETLTRTYDKTAPTVTELSSTTPSSFNASDTFTAKVVFSEAVTNFTAASVTVVNGKASAVTAVADAAENTAWTFTVTPDAEGAVSVSIAADAVRDYARNGNAASTKTLTRTYDTTAPMVAFDETCTPANGSATNVKHFKLAATATDSLSTTTCHWIYKNEVTDGASLERDIDGDGDYTVQVFATDAARNVSVTNTWSWTLDTVKPTVTSLTSDTPDPFKASDVFTVAISFSEAVTNFTTASVHVDNGAATVCTGSGADYTVTITPTADGNVTVSVPADVVADAAGNTNEAYTPTLTRTYDTTAPTVTELSSATPNPFGPANVFTVTVTFSEDVTNVTTSAIAAANGMVDAVTGSGASWTFTISPTIEKGDVTVSVPTTDVTDLAGNACTASDKTLTRTYDQTAPTAALASDAPAAVNQAFTVKVTFNVAVTNFTAESITVDNGKASAVTAVAGAAKDTAWTFTVTPSGEGAVKVTIPANVVANSVGTKNLASDPLMRTYDITRPTVALTSAAAARVNGAFAVTATFSEVVTNFTASCVTVMNGTASIAGSGKVYTLTITPQTEGTVTVAIAKDAVKDLAGNGNVASETVPRTYDKTAPTVTLASTTPDPFNASETFTVTATFSEDVTNFTASCVTVVNGTASIAGSGKVYTLTITPQKEGTVTVAIAKDAVKDLAGNGNAASETVPRTYDKTAPTVTLASTTPDPFNASETFTVTVTISETVTNFSAQAVQVTNGSVASVTGSGKSYTVTVTPTAEGNVTIQVPAGKVTDAAGNYNTASSTLTKRYDATAPGATLTRVTPERFNTDFVFTVAFDEAVTAPAASGIAVENGTVTSVAATGAANTWQVTVSPSEEGTVTAQVKAAAVTDEARNPNAASASVEGVYDITPPTVELTSETPQWFCASNAPLVVTAVFSEPVTNVTAATFAVTNGELTNLVQQTETELPTWVLMIAPNAVPDENENETVSVSVVKGAVADRAANPIGDTDTLTRIYDTKRPTVTSLAWSAVTPEFLLADSPIAVTVTFSEVMTNFTANTLTVENGSVTNWVTSDQRTYEAWIEPAAYEGVNTKEDQTQTVTVGVNADGITDLAGNGNEAYVDENGNKKTASRSGDTQRPWVEVTGLKTYTDFLPTLKFTFKGYKDRVNSSGSYIKAITEGTVINVANSSNVYTVKITSAEEGKIVIRISANMVWDSNGNYNAETDVTLYYDKSAPANLGIKAETNDETGDYALTATYDDVTPVTIDWYDGVTSNRLTSGTSGYTGTAAEGETVKRYFVATDSLSNKTTSATWTWTWAGAKTHNVEFEGGISVAVDPDTGKTNEVTFTLVDFKPGATSKFTLSGFTATEPVDLAKVALWFLVNENLKDDIGHAKATATGYSAGTGTLTVTLPAKATEGKKSFFIHGIDNKEN